MRDNLKAWTLSSSEQIFDPSTIPQKASMVFEVAILISCLSDMTGLSLRKRKKEMNLFDFFFSIPVTLFKYYVEIVYEIAVILMTVQLLFNWGSFHQYYNVLVMLNFIYRIWYWEQKYSVKSNLFLLLYFS